MRLLLTSLSLLLALAGSSRGMDPDRDEPKFAVSLVTRKPDNVDPAAEVVNIGRGRDGRAYACAVPPLTAAAEESAAEEEGDEVTTWMSVVDVIGKLRDSCFYRVEGWWTVELCFFKHIRQYHQEGKKIETEFFLGHVTEARMRADDPEAAKVSPFDARAGTDPTTKKPFYSIGFGDGTTCDLTGQPRTSEVRLSCSPERGNQIVNIEEPSTCHYTVLFGTPLLCSHPAFKEKIIEEQEIQCWPVEAAKPKPPAAPKTTTRRAPSKAKPPVVPTSQIVDKDAAEPEAADEADADAEHVAAALAAQKEKLARMAKEKEAAAAQARAHEAHDKAQQAREAAKAKTAVLREKQQQDAKAHQEAHAAAHARARAETAKQQKAKAEAEAKKKQQESGGEHDDL